MAILSSLIEKEKQRVKTLIDARFYSIELTDLLIKELENLSKRKILFQSEIDGLKSRKIKTINALDLHIKANDELQECLEKKNAKEND